MLISSSLVLLLELINAHRRRCILLLGLFNNTLTAMVNQGILVLLSHIREDAIYCFGKFVVFFCNNISCVVC